MCNLDSRFFVFVIGVLRTIVATKSEAVPQLHFHCSHFTHVFLDSTILSCFLLRIHFVRMSFMCNDRYLGPDPLLCSLSLRVNRWSRNCIWTLNFCSSCQILLPMCVLVWHCHSELDWVGGSISWHETRYVITVRGSQIWNKSFALHFSFCGLIYVATDEGWRRSRSSFRSRALLPSTDLLGASHYC
jgi:hypothetical protein